MLKKLTSSIYWALAVDQSREGSLDKCLKYLQKYIDIRGESARSLSLYAVTLVGKGNSKEAKKYFELAHDLIRANDDESPGNKYLNLYIIYWLKALNGEPDESLVEEALKIPISNSMKRALPLAPGFEE